LHERKQLLRRILDHAPSDRIVYVDYLVGQGAELFAAVKQIGAEGIVSKRLASIYRGGDSRDWVKTKCFETGTFHIVGFKELGEGRLEELRVAEAHNDEMRPAGHIQFGFAGKGLWEMVDARRAGPARKGVVPVQPMTATVR
jgi:bifunctional non-homologous end joining protein LigD